MNTRQSIQPSTTPAVLSLAFSSTRNRFIAGLSIGLRVFRTDNCLATYQPQPQPLSPNSTPDSAILDGGIAVAEALDDRFIAFVAGGRIPSGKGSVAVFWDCVLEREVCRFDFQEAVLGVRVSGRWMCVVLRERTVVFAYQQLELETRGGRQQQPSPPSDDEDVEYETKTTTRATEETTTNGPNKVQALHPTAPNPFALACLRDSLLALPAQSTGQVHLISLSGGSKRVLRAHKTALRCMALSPDGTLLATTSEQGTLIRVFDTRTLDQVAEFRRGVEKAVVLGLGISDGNRWVGVSSDKGTVHVFDLRPPLPGDSTPAPVAGRASDVNKMQTQHRKSNSHPHPHRLSTGTAALEKDSRSLSAFSNRSSSPASTSATATHQGSVQEYYGLRPPPASASPPGQAAAISAVAAFKSSPFAPKVLTDVRSIASAPFDLGDEARHWQGGSGAAYSWTTTPAGGRKRVPNLVPSLPNEPTGRPPKGVLAFAPAGKGGGGVDDEGAVLYVIGGGGDAKWEMFDLLPAAVEKSGGSGWVLVKRGFRRYLSRQFVD